MDKKDKISVILPVFNGEKHIENCLESLICQSYDNLEIIIVNDGSTDNSEKCIKKYIDKDKRIVYLKQQNLGTSCARNAGLKICTGKFFCFVDVDDTIYVDYCRDMILYMNNDVDAVVCGVQVSYNGEITREIPILNKVTGEEARRNILEQKYASGFVWNKLFRTSVIRSEKLYFPEGMIYEDLLFCYQYFNYANRIQYIDKVLYHYMRRQGSLCTNYNNPHRMLDLIEIMKILEKETNMTDLNLKAYIFFLHNQLIRLNNYYIRSDYIDNDVIFKQCAMYIIDRIQTLLLYEEK